MATRGWGRASLSGLMGQDTRENLSIIPGMEKVGKICCEYDNYFNPLLDCITILYYVIVREVAH